MTPWRVYTNSLYGNSIITYPQGKNPIQWIRTGLAFNDSNQEKYIAQYAKMLYIVYKRKHKDTSIVLALKMAEPVKLQN